MEAIHATDFVPENIELSFVCKQLHVTSKRGHYFFFGGEGSICGTKTFFIEGTGNIHNQFLTKKEG